MLLQPLVLVYLVHDEKQSVLPGYLHAGLSVLPVVEPCLRPPPDSGLVGIDADDPRDVEALDNDVKSLQGIDDAAARYGFVMGFFFNPSSQVERKVPCSSAR